MREHLRSERKAQHCFIALVALADPRLLAEASGVRVTFKFAPVPADRTTQETTQQTTQETTQQTTQEMASTPQDRICHLLRGEPA